MIKIEDQDNVKIEEIIEENFDNDNKNILNIPTAFTEQQISEQPQNNKEQLNMNSITQYCQSEGCLKKSTKKGKYKFLCHIHQKNYDDVLNPYKPNILDIPNVENHEIQVQDKINEIQDHEKLSNKFAAKALYRFHKSMYLSMEALTKICSENELEGLSKIVEDDKKELIDIYNDIVNQYGIEAVEYICTPFASLTIMSINHVVCAYGENQKKKLSSNELKDELIIL